MNNNNSIPNIIIVLPHIKCSITNNLNTLRLLERCNRLFLTKTNTRYILFNSIHLYCRQTDRFVICYCCVFVERNSMGTTN